MIRLVRAELLRFVAHRTILLLLLLAPLAAVAVASVSAWESRPPSAAELATARAQAELDESSEDVSADSRAQLERCLTDPEIPLGPGADQGDCEAAFGTSAANYLPRAPLNLQGTLKGNGRGLALLVCGLLIVAASSFVGRDLASGSLTTQVLAAPGRDRLWAAKAAAVTLWSGVVAAVSLGGFWLALYLVASDRGVPHGSPVVDDVVWHAVRAVLLCAGAALGAYAVTLLLRSAFATLGLLFAVSVGGELAMALLPVDRLARWTLGTNLLGWLETRSTYTDCGGLGACQPEHLSHPAAGLYLVVALAVAVAVSVLVFRRRDL